MLADLDTTAEGYVWLDAQKRQIVSRDVRFRKPERCRFRKPENDPVVAQLEKLCIRASLENPLKNSRFVLGYV